jgi:Mg2+-importing ATPase
MSLSQQSQDLLSTLKSRYEGLTATEVLSRKAFKRAKCSNNAIGIQIFYNNFKSPLVLLLLGTAFFSVYVHDLLNALIIFSIVTVSGLISFFQELKAYLKTQRLIESMHMTQEVIRDGVRCSIDPQELVEGDILLIDAGDLIPLNCQLIESTDLFANESSITGESIPKEKHVHEDSLVKMGSSIVSGFGRAVILPQDQDQSFNELLNYISKNQSPSSFSQNLTLFAKFLMKITLSFTALVLLILLIAGTSPLNAILFSLSIAVGLSPQLLPAILSTNLAIGSSKMAKVGALTKKLDSIENFGNMDLLCCDKTGTLTKGKIEMYAALDSNGLNSDEVAKWGYINALLQTGFTNTLDQAIIEKKPFDSTHVLKLDEIPYDFNRKMLSILAQIDQQNLLICKGALENVLLRCSLTEIEKHQILERAHTYYLEGFRILGLAIKPLKETKATLSDEYALCFQGFLLFFDPIKEDSQAMIAHLKNLGIRLVMITGDHPVIASFVANQAGFARPECFEGAEVKNLSDDILKHCDVYGRVEPMDKAHLINQFKLLGYTVGYMGDGMNDAGALFAADVGICVESGADIAKATADFILVKKQLSIITAAVIEGRKIFSNTLKYILMAISANFGNMFSMALVALFIPFLPLLPTQILLINLLQDIPEMSISVDHVDPQIIHQPQKWNIKFIKYFMIVFGPISSLFDLATFFTLKYFSASAELFRSAWFTESVISATLIILFIRTRAPFYKSRPSWVLSILVFSVITFTLLIPYTPLGAIFAIIALPTKYYVAIGLIVLAYALVVELAKGIFYKWMRKKSTISLS